MKKKESTGVCLGSIPCCRMKHYPMNVEAFNLTFADKMLLSDVSIHSAAATSSYIICYARIRNQKQNQDECRNRCLFTNEVESQDIRDTKYRTAGKGVVNHKRYQNQESEFRS